MKNIIIKGLLASAIVLLLGAAFKNYVFGAIYENKYTEDEADIVFNMEFDKTNLVAGDEFSVVYSLDKLPDNGYGVASANFRLIYDSTEVECLSIEEGPISKEFTIHSAPDDTEFDEFENSRQVVWAGASGGSDAVCESGIIATIKFKVKEDIKSKKINMYLQGTNGFNASGVKLNDQNRPVVDTSKKVYLKTNCTDSLNICQKGDINKDGKVDLVDVFLAYNNYLDGENITTEKKNLSDINKDNVVNLVDVFLVYNIYLKSSI